MKLHSFALGFCSASLFALAAHAETLTIATVNNGDMIRMQKMTKPFTDANPDIQLEWVTLEETCCASASPPTSPPRAASTT